MIQSNTIFFKLVYLTHNGCLPGPNIVSKSGTNNISYTPDRQNLTITCIIGFGFVLISFIAYQSL